MRIMVTGAAGFIGRHLVTELRDHGHEVFPVDRAEGDLLAPGVARDLVGRTMPAVVVHLAAQVGREFGERDLSHTINTNATMTALVAQACEDHGARLVYASTSEIYGDQGDGEVFEDSPKGLPYNLYGLSKRWGEEVAQLYCDYTTSLRFSMPYGPGLPAGKGRAAIINMLWQAAHGEVLTPHEGATRCWCWIGDTVEGARMVIESGRTGAFNIGRDDNETSMYDVAQIACQIAGADKSLIRPIPAPANQVIVKRLKTDRLRSLGWSPWVDLHMGMYATYQAMGLKK